MSFTAAEIAAAVARRRRRRATEARSFDQHVQDIRCDIAVLAAPEHERGIAYDLAMAERTGIRSVWKHGLWRLEDGRWHAAA